MKLTIGFSPCPNDTFIFDALIHNKIDTEGLSFEAILEDVETLNQWSSEGKLDISKLSFPALFLNANKYQILNSGAALGKGVGPLLIAKTMINVHDAKYSTVAIPGANTTANFLLNYSFPFLENKKILRFDEIEDAVLNNETDMGVIIHENRFTYMQKGLVKLLDLGEHWEEKTGAPIPLGCIAIKKEIDLETQKKVDELIRKSLVYAFNQYPQIADYVKQHAQEMDENIMRQHIELYVNNYSADLGEEGKKAIHILHDVYKQQKEKDQIGDIHFLS